LQHPEESDFKNQCEVNKKNNSRGVTSIPKLRLTIINRQIIDHKLLCQLPPKLSFYE
jgi:hypothetical protein